MFCIEHICISNICMSNSVMTVFQVFQRKIDKVFPNGKMWMHILPCAESVFSFRLPPSSRSPFTGGPVRRTGHRPDDVGEHSSAYCRFEFPQPIECFPGSCGVNLSHVADMTKRWGF